MLWQQLDFIANDRQVPTTSVVGILAHSGKLLSYWIHHRTTHIGMEDMLTIVSESPGFCADKQWGQIHWQCWPASEGSLTGSNECLYDWVTQQVSPTCRQGEPRLKQLTVWNMDSYVVGLWNLEKLFQDSISEQRLISVVPFLHKICSICRDYTHP